jgi:hypothetical protein
MDLREPLLDSSVPRLDTPRPNLEMELRTPSYMFNHGGLYAPGNPRLCNTPGGPCSSCEERIEEEDTAITLLSLKDCCNTRPEFLEPCPMCGKVGSYVSHESKGLKTCNGCEDMFCSECYYGSRYCCAYVYGELPRPARAERSETLGVQSPNVEEKKENK